VRVRMSMAVYDRVIEISEHERRPFSQVTASLILLGCGVWRRLREHPKILKGLDFKDKAELLLLADLQQLEALWQLQAEEAEKWIARDADRRARELAERGDWPPPRA
jgi:hypothetical protein